MKEPTAKLSPQKAMELFLSRDVRNLLDQLSAAFQVRAVFFDADGKPLLRGRELANCRCCTLIQQSPEGFARCHTLDKIKQAEAAKSGSMICYTCHAGLMEAVAPVKSGDNCIGFVVIGQFREAGATPPEYLSQEAKEAFFEQPQVSADELKARLGLFRSLVSYIASRELLLLSGVRKIDIINRYIDTHLTEKITLTDLARHIGSSVSGLTHYLRENFHTSFKSLLIEKRLEQAEKLLRSTPQMSIAEVAEKVGYDDCFYFSRLFRKHRGLPPRNCRALQEEQK